MFQFILLFSSLGLLFRNGISELQRNYEPRFEYEFKVLKTLALLEIGQKQIQDKLHQNNARVEEQMLHLQTIQKDLDNTGERVDVIEKGTRKEGSGSTYIIWGRKTCPAENGIETVYSGFAAGGWTDQTGTGSNSLCLTSQPLWSKYNDATLDYSTIYGSEYRGDNDKLKPLFGKYLQSEDVPCARCRSTRATTIMIPGRNRCYDGWTMEYSGYIVSGYIGHKHGSEYLCLDIVAEVIQGGSGSSGGNFFYVTEARCGSLKCPPYVNNREVTCAVCSK